jgi:hypothetical protein
MAVFPASAAAVVYIPAIVCSAGDRILCGAIKFALGIAFASQLIDKGPLSMERHSTQGQRFGYASFPPTLDHGLAAPNFSCCYEPFHIGCCEKNYAINVLI